MVSININQNFSGKNINNQNSNSEDTSLLDNIFSAIFANLEEKDSLLKEITNNNFLTDKTDEVDINNEFIFNSIEVKDLNIDQILEKNKLNFFKKIKKINLINENSISNNNYEISFEIDIDNFYSKLKEKLNIIKSSMKEKFLRDEFSSSNLIYKTKKDIKKLNLINQTFEQNNSDNLKNLKPDFLKNSLKTQNLNSNSLQKKSDKKSNSIDNNNLNEIKKTERVLNIKEINSSNIIIEDNDEKNSDEYRNRDRVENISNSSNQKILSKNFKLNNSFQSNNTSLLENQLHMLEKNWGNKLARIIEKAILTGKEKISISLEPKRLGKLNLNLSLNQNNANIVINTENAASALLLNGSEEKLSQIFESSGLKLTNFQANSNNKGNNQKNKKNEVLLDLKEADKKKDEIDINKKKAHNENHSTVNLIA